MAKPGTLLPSAPDSLVEASIKGGQTHRRTVGRAGPPSLVLAMLDTESHTPRRLAIRASRPALNDLRFKGDACVVQGGDDAAVCLGDYRLTTLAATPLDLPAMNRAFLQVRLGQARRLASRRGV